MIIVKDKNSISKLETISLIVIILLLSVVCLGSILVIYKSIELKELSYYIVSFLPFELILYIATKIYKPTFKKEEILIFILFVLTTLSLIGSNNLETSIFGFYKRYEGLLMLYTYYSTALVASTISKEMYKKIIIGFIIGIGFLNILYGLLQTGLISLNINIMGAWKYSKGFLGNSMNYATLLSICYFFIVGIFLYSNKKTDLNTILLLIIFTIGNIISGSMALLLTTIFILSLLMLKELLNIKYKKFSLNQFLKILLCLLLFVSFNRIFMHRYKDYRVDVNSFSKEVSNVTKSEKNKNSYGTGRIYIWKEVLKKSKDNLIFGVGVDNLYNSFDPELIDPASNYSVDKAHNDYLQKLLCEGFLSFICYISLIILIIKKHIKDKNNINKILLIGFLAYAVDIFFSISVIRVAPLYWIILGLLIGVEEEIKKQKEIR